MCLFDDATLTHIQEYGDLRPRASNCRPLTNQNVLLSSTLAKFSKNEFNRHERLHYGFSKLWQTFVGKRAKPVGKPAFSLVHSQEASSLASSIISLALAVTITISTQLLVRSTSPVSAVAQPMQSPKYAVAFTLTKMSPAATLTLSFAIPRAPVSDDENVSQRSMVQVFST